MKQILRRRKGRRIKTTFWREIRNTEVHGQGEMGKKGEENHYFEVPP
jgi:hypothetical protein